MKLISTTLLITFFFLPILFLSGCDKKQQKLSNKKKTHKLATQKLKTKVINKKSSVKNDNNKTEQLALDLSNLTNLLNQFDFELEAQKIAQKMKEIPYEVRMTNDILKPNFVYQFTNIIKNAKTILKFAIPMSTELAKESDMKALIDILLYAESISKDSLEKSRLFSLIGFMYDRMMDLDTELYYNEKQFNYAKESGIEKAIIEAYGSLSLNLANLDRREEALKLCDEISEKYPDYSEYFKCQCQSLGSQEIDNTIIMYENLLKRQDLSENVRNMAENDLQLLKVNRIKYRNRKK